MFTKGIVASFDLGPNNTSISVIEAIYKNNNIHRVTILHSSMIEHSIDNLTEEFHSKCILFIKEIKNIVKLYEPDMVLFERFQQRAMRKGAVDEKISIMNGIIASSCLIFRPKTIVRPVTPAQWKNRFYQFFGKDTLTSLYEQNKKHAHMIDSFLISIYAFDLYGEIEKRMLLSPMIQYLVKNFTPVHSIKKPTSKPARLKNARRISRKKIKKAGAYTTF